MYAAKRRTRAFRLLIVDDQLLFREGLLALCADLAGVETTGCDLAEAPEVTEPPESELDPVAGGKLVVAGEAEVANPWTPAAMNCDSFCHMRARTFYDPLMVIDDRLETQGHLAESVQPNEDHTVFTVKVREGISFHDGTPLDADAVMDNINRSFSSLLISAAVKDVARNADGTKATLPVGARIRLEGRLTGKWTLDGLPLLVDGSTRLKKDPSIGNYVRVRGVVQGDGSIRATRIRRR